MNKIKQHLQKYIGWYFLVSSIWMMFQEGYGFEGFLIFFLTILKVPPFDLVGRGFDWVFYFVSLLGLKVKAWKEQQSRPVRVLVTIIAIIVIILIVWFMPECELC
jgi:hypothetical protein